MSGPLTPSCPASLRAARAEDDPVITGLCRESGIPAWSQEEIQRQVSWDCVVAECDGRVVGFYLSQVAADELLLLALAVHTEKRSQGIGRLLLNGCLAAGRLRGCQVCHLEVRAGNAAAVRLYQEAGFQSVGVRKGYYRQPAQDALLMSCRL